MLRKVELHWLELAVTFQVRLKVLQKNNFLANRSWVVKEVVLVQLLHRSSEVLFISDAVDINKVEKICRSDNLSTVVKQHSECTGSELVAEAVLCAEIYKLSNKLCLGLVTVRHN